MVSLVFPTIPSGLSCACKLLASSLIYHQQTLKRYMNDSNPLFLASFFTFPELENMKKIKVLYPWDEDHVRIDDVSLNPNSRGEPRELSINNITTVEDHSCVDFGSGSNGTSEQEFANKRTTLFSKTLECKNHYYPKYSESKK